MPRSSEFPSWLLGFVLVCRCPFKTQLAFGNSALSLTFIWAEFQGQPEERAYGLQLRAYLYAWAQPWACARLHDSQICHSFINLPEASFTPTFPFHIFDLPVVFPPVPHHWIIKILLQQYLFSANTLPKGCCSEGLWVKSNKDKAEKGDHRQLK